MRFLVLVFVGCEAGSGEGAGPLVNASCADPDRWTCSSDGDGGCDAVCDAGLWLYCDGEVNGGYCLVREGMAEQECEAPTGSVGCGICDEALRSTCKTLLR